MKRFHVHVSVDDLAASIRFYSAVFASTPTVQKPDYAKWMLDDPRINFAISQRGAPVGVDHLGIQVDSAEELAGLHAQLQAAELASVAESGTCCYAESNKHWTTDPSGIAWESYHTLADAPTFNGQPDAQVSASACCAPAAEPVRFTVRPKTSCAPGSGCC